MAFTHDPTAQEWAWRHLEIRGVNLGGWLLAERWLVGGDAPYIQTTCCDHVLNPYDSSTLDCRQQGVDPASDPIMCQDDERALSEWRRRNQSVHTVMAFRNAFITADDFALMSSYGLNSVRIPIGHWVVIPHYPYIHGRGLSYIDDAVRWAKEYNLTVLLDLHGAVGSQNGKQTSGLEDWSWRPSDFNKTATLQVLRTLASRYANETHVIAIELLNEAEIPISDLLPFYQKASDIVREYMPAGRVAVVINLFYIYEVMTVAWASLNWYLPSSRYPNIVYDLHLYYTFAAKGAKWVGLQFWTSRVLVEIQTALLSVTGRPSFVGEWSLAIPTSAKTQSGKDWEALSQDERVELRTAFASRQIAAMTRGSRVGGYFWTWLAPVSGPSWSYRKAIEGGYISKAQWSAPPPAPY
eukprot:CAMPEP_0174705944 /NCGR_PEP_ID=MMETSP1094-20130205/8973_1 /TAXON_ID=156173 /ORGANISM="Chrysochromulina brevifilum, Strain UTEX LB 985" /LENGTH=409 /DNA_ID=CAMNT_0015904163 /DNA_START=108 /DNA_END=1337 /DNA_ORIENTATION=+